MASIPSPITSDDRGAVAVDSAIGISSSSAPTTTEADVPLGSTVAETGHDVYHRVSMSLLPGWQQWLCDASQLAAIETDRRVDDEPERSLHRRIAVAAALGLVEAFGRSGDDSALNRELVRTTLVHWQLSLTGRGCPIRASAPHTTLGVTTGHVAMLLSDAGDYLNNELLDDVRRHAAWVARLSPADAWIDGVTLCALADCAVLVRDTSLLKSARARLAVLVQRQTREGWFPEAGGADLGRSFLLLDALARLFVQHRWVELAEPLGRLLDFVAHFVHPNGCAGGCYGSCDNAFISPYGVELLSPTFPAAAALVGPCRAWFSDSVNVGALAMHGELGPLLGVRLALASSVASSVETRPEELRTCRLGTTVFPQSALTVVSTRRYHAVIDTARGGALRVTWRGGRRPLDDAGIVVVTKHGEMLGAGRGVASPQGSNERDIRVTAVLRPLRESRRIGFLFLRTRAHHGRDRVERTIHFSEDRVTIRDHVHCGRDARTIICPAPRLRRGVPVAGCRVGEPPLGPPMFIEAGRHVAIERTYQDGELID